MSWCGRLLAVATLLAAMAATEADASSCAAACVRRMTDCHAERCEGLSLRACRDRCRAVTGCRAGGARIRTLATVVSECQVRDGQMTSKQRLEIKRGDCPPTRVMEIESTSVPDSDPSICEGYGLHRDGTTAVVIGAFQRLGVSHDGRTVLFELNTHIREPSAAGPSFSVEEGIFAVGPKGVVRKVTRESSERSYRDYDYPPFGRYIPVFGQFSFSPSGRFVAFSDRGPGADGSDFAQVVVLDLETDERTQWTKFNRPLAENTTGPNVTAFFLDDDTIGAYAYGQPDASYFIVKRDGMVPVLVSPFETIGGKVETTFGLAGPFGTTVTVAFPDHPTTAPFPGPVVELFAYGRPNRLLQLTTFRRSDVLAGPSQTTGDRVFFLASTNALKTNPTNACQIFSIDRLGTRLRQLTTFDPGVSSAIGCVGGPLPPECRVTLTSALQFDATTGTLVFDATCDPFGLHPVGGQVFAMRRDGTGLRQLTNYRGMQGTAADGTLDVELPGPIEYSGVKN